MAAPAPVRRRITPQLVQSSPSQAEAGTAGSAARTVPPAVAPANTDAVFKAGPGRRIYVDISQNNTVNWRQLLKQRGASKKAPQAAQPGGGLALPGTGAFPGGLGGADPLGPPRHKKPRGSFFESIVQKLERQYMIGESSDDEDANSDPPSAEDEEAVDTEEETDTPEEEDALNEGFVAYEDDFVDDSELLRYKGGIKHKARHSGFYLNAGDIEGQEEDAKASNDEAEKPKKKAKKAAAGRKLEVEGPQGQGAGPEAPLKPKAAKKVAGEGAQGPAEGSGAEGAARPRKRKAGDDGERPPKKQTKQALQAKHADAAGPSTAVAAAGTQGAAAPATAAAPSLAAQALKAAKAASSKPKRPPGPSAPGQQAAAAPSTSAPASPAPTAQRQQQQMGSPGVPASIAEEAAAQTAARSAAATSSQAQPTTTAAAQQAPKPTLSSLLPQKWAAGGDAGTGTSSKLKKAGSGGAGSVAGPSSARASSPPFSGAVPAETALALSRLQDAVATANKSSTTVPKAVRQALEALASQLHRDAKGTPGLKAALVESVSPLMEGWMSAKVVKRRLADDIDKQEAALEGAGGMLDTLCASLAAMAQDLWGDGAGSDDDFKESPRSRWSTAVEDDLAAAWDAHNAVHGVAEAPRLLARLQAALPDHPLSEQELQQAYLRAKKRRTQAKAAQRRQQHSTQAGPSQAGPSQATPQVMPHATPRQGTPQAAAQPSQQPSQKQQQQQQQQQQPLAQQPSASAPLPVQAPSPGIQQLQAGLQQLMAQPSILQQPSTWPAVAKTIGVPEAMIRAAAGQWQASQEPPGDAAGLGPQAAAASSAQPASATAAAPAPAAAEPNDGAAAAAAAAPAPAQPLPSVEDCIAAAAAAGADAARLAQGAASLKQGSVLHYAWRILCMAGRDGLSLKDVVAAGVAGGVPGWENEEKRRRSVYSSVSNSDLVANIGHNKWALTAFPGVEAKPKAPKDKEAAGSGAAAAGAMTEPTAAADQAPPADAALD